MKHIGRLAGAAFLAALVACSGDDDGEPVPFENRRCQEPSCCAAYDAWLECATSAPDSGACARSEPDLQGAFIAACEPAPGYGIPDSNGCGAICDSL